MAERTCVGCRAVRDKASMVRFTVVDGRLEPDLDGRARGRGVYVCCRECLAQACKRKDVFHRALRTRLEQADPGILWDKVMASGYKGNGA